MESVAMTAIDSGKASPNTSVNIRLYLSIKVGCVAAYRCAKLCVAKGRPTEGSLVICVCLLVWLCPSVCKRLYMSD